MNICLFTRTTLHHSMGGMEQHIRMLSEGLVKKGDKVTILTTALNSQKEYEKINGVDIFFLKNTKPGRYSKKFNVSAYKKFVELHKIEKFDLIHSQSGGAFYILRKRINKKFKIPAIVTMHGIFYNELKTRLNILFSKSSFKEKIKSILLSMYYIYIYIFKDMQSLRKADGIISTSLKQRNLIKKMYFMEDSKLFTVFNGVEIEENRNSFDLVGFKNKFNLSGSNVLLCLARLKKEKGIQVAVEALAEIIKKYSNTKLFIVGDGEYKGELVKLTNSLNLNNNVIFAGETEYQELYKYFCASDVFINSTLRENGYDLTIVMAMGYSKPVVVTALKSLAGVIEDNKNGVLIKMGDVNALSEKICYLIENKEYSKEISLKARKTYEENFSAEKMVDNTIKVYAAVINSMR